MAKSLIERYFTDLAEIRGTRSNVPETSFYPALEHLLTEVGKTLSPKVRCVINLSNRGAGLPDGGLFTADQFRRMKHDEKAQSSPLSVQIPARGVLEAKPPRDDMQAIVESEQIERYWKRYGMVLVTNFRSFALVGKDSSGKPTVLETFSLAATENDFWKLLHHSQKAAHVHGERLLEYLRRVMLHNAPLAAPQDVAALLASYAHDARLRIEHAELPALQSLREALEEALGLHFEGEKGEHFFRSTLVQTLFYGVFSAWVLWARRHDAKPEERGGYIGMVRESSSSYTPSGPFDWRSAHYLLRVPMLRALFVQVADPGRLGPLNLIEVLDWTASALNRVDRAEFFASFDEGHAVQYFYEPFLQAFDAELRKELGVWYTPEEIVHYQVERVDAVLRSELGLADGLADPNVVVLDPCCGTGAYLRAVLRRIAKTLHDKGGDALVAHDLKKAAMERVFGFEILPAPFVVAHLQLGLELENLGAPLSGSEDNPERVGVYLTNALTGWEPPKEKPKQIAFPGFEEERDAAGKVKREKPILVILGNPPYNSFAGVSPAEEDGLIEAYKKGLIADWGIKKFNLDELYARFFRLAERRIAEKGGRGVVSFITSFSYLSDPSFVVLRKRFLDGFDSIWIDCMNGDSRETGKRTPDGKPDPSAFSTEWNREGIRLGTAVGLFVKRGLPEDDGEKKVLYRDFWGTAKRAELAASLDVEDFKAQYMPSVPSKENRWNFRPSEVANHYLEWPKILELSAVSSYNGPVERRAFALISHEKDALEKRIGAYFDPVISNEEIGAMHHALMMTGNRIVGPEARAKILKEHSYDEKCITQYPFKPFDVRWCYLENLRPLFSEPSPQLLNQRMPNNHFFITRDTADKDPEGPPFMFSSLVCDYDSISGHARHFPVMLRKHEPQKKTSENPSLFSVQGASECYANLSAGVRAYLAALDLPDPDAEQEVAELVWYHALAVGYSPAYLTENADGIRQDWPRIPLPASKDVLLASAALGRQVAVLLDTEAPVKGITTGTVREKLKNIAVFVRVDGKPAKPDSGDLDITAGWGHAGKGGITMPGKGKLIDRGDAYDVFLNEYACWQNVPKPVWNYVIGGYQVIKKWLSYREKPLLGRGLTVDEVRYVTEMARRIAALVALNPALDENYRNIIKETCVWPR